MNSNTSTLAFWWLSCLTHSKKKKETALVSYLRRLQLEESEAKELTTVQNPCCYHWWCKSTGENSTVDLIRKIFSYNSSLFFFA